MSEAIQVGPPGALNKSRSTLIPRTASAVLTQLLSTPTMRADLSALTAVSEVTVDRAVSMLRALDITIDSEKGRGAGCLYSVRGAGAIRSRLAVSLRLSLGDLIEAGGVSPAVGVGLLIEAGAL